MDMFTLSGGKFHEAFAPESLELYDDHFDVI
jgi:hypothetical protein